MYICNTMLQAKFRTVSILDHQREIPICQFSRYKGTTKYIKFWR